MQMMAILLLSLRAAWAGPVEDKLDEALAAIQEADFERATALLAEAEELAPQSPTVVVGPQLARIHYYRGIVEFYVGDRDRKALDEFRKALVLDLTYPWDTSLVVEEEPQALFEALRNEVASRPQVKLGAPDDVPGLRAYVDGRLVHPYDTVIEGRHLVQVLCPDNQLKGAWHTFGDPPDWFSFCPGVEPTASGDSEPTGAGGGKAANPLRLGLWGASAALLAAGTATNFLLVEPAWDDIQYANEHPGEFTAAEADDLVATFNRRRYTTLALLGGGVAALAGGFVAGMDLGVVPVGPGVVFVGRF